MFICYPIYGIVRWITVVINGREYRLPIFGVVGWQCIRVPVLEWPIQFPWPPEKIREIGDWIHGEKINPVAAADLRILATMANLQHGLADPEAKGLLHESLASAVARLDLPPEVRVQFNGHVIREHTLPELPELPPDEAGCE